MLARGAWHRGIGLLALAGAGNCVAALLAYRFALNPGGIVVVWAPAGFALALLVLIERERWPFAIVGAVVGNIGADMLHGTSASMAFAGSAANAVESLVAAWVLVRFFGRRLALGTLREVGGLVIGAVVISNAVTALAGATMLWNGWHMPFREAWFVWWAGDGMGMLIVAPVILTWVHAVRHFRKIPTRTVVEAAAVCLAIAFVARAALAPKLSGSALGGHPYLAFPLLLWAAIRLGPWGAATGTVVLAAMMALNTSQASAAALTAGESPMSRVLELYSFLALASVSSLVPASILAERTRSDRRLLDSEERFRQMAEHINEAFFVVDLDTGKPLYVSPTWGEIWGRPMSAAYDPQIWFNAIHPDDRAEMAIAQAALKRGEASDSSFRVVRPNGSERWVHGRAFPVRDKTGRVYRMTGVSSDITDLRQAEQRFAQAQKMEAMGRLAGGVAHDFNNLLTVILGETEALGATLPPSEDTTEFLTGIRTAGESAAVLTRQLLAFSRKQLVEPTVFAVNDAVEGVSKMLRRLIGEDVLLQMRLSPKAGQIRADRGQIEQVLTNLAVNARDAMPDGGTLTIESGFAVLDAEFVKLHPGSHAGEFAVISMTDTGCGMTPEIVARVFEPFFTTKEVGKGTGLGLAMCYGIVKQAHGYITVESELNAGTTFRIHFPVAGTDPATAEHAAPVPVPRGNETIMIVEDESGVRRVAARLLRELGYRVFEARDAVEAHRTLAADPTKVDLIFTDVVLPGMNGRELADLVEAMRPGIRVLFATGYTDDIVLQHRLTARDVLVLRKPYTRSALAGAVRRVLDTPRPSDAGAAPKT